MALILPRRKAGAVDIADVFSTDLYTGNGSSQTITNGIDLSGEGGLVWIKARSAADNNILIDTDRGDGKKLFSNLTNAQTDDLAWNSFLNNGFSLDGDNTGAQTNENGRTYAAWTFRKSPSFFDVVTYTGDGSTSRAISHNLGIAPGMVIVKSLSSVQDWAVFHRETTSADPERRNLILNGTSAATFSTNWDYTLPDENNFYTRGGDVNNGNGVDYVAYLFAHDTTDNGVIQCGSFTTDGSGDATVTLGWEPQLLIAKRTDSTSNWLIVDNARGSSQELYANLPNAEGSGGFFASNTFNSTGFVWDNSFASADFIYIAIRKEGI